VLKIKEGKICKIILIKGFEEFGAQNRSKDKIYGHDDHQGL
jgi:hypothetical protein